MPRHKSLAAHLPYCIQKMTHGGHVILNRDYKPVGFTTKEHVDYSNYPISVKFKGLSQTIASKISWRGDTNTETIYLYNDGTIPTANESNWKAYSERLRHLAALQIDESWVQPTAENI